VYVCVNVERKDKRESRSKYFLITDNKAQLNKWDRVKQMENKELVRGVWQLEKAPETNRLHVQAYVVFTNKVRFSDIKRLFQMDHLHIEKRKGTEEQASAYCKKEESRHYFEDDSCYMWEFGIFIVANE